MTPGLRARVAALIGLTTAAAGLATTALLNSMEEVRLRNHVQSETAAYRSMVQTTASLLAGERGCGDVPKEALRALAARIAELNSVSWVGIFDCNGRSLAHSDPNDVRQGSAEQARYVGQVLRTGVDAELTEREGGALVSFIPVFRQGHDREKPTGVVALAMTTARIEADLARARRGTLLSILVSATIGCAVLFVALDRRVLSPIRRLADKASQAGGAELFSGESSFRDELDRLDSILARCIETLESKAQTSATRYQNLVAALPHGVREVDLEGRISFSNPAHTRLLGYESDTELVGKYVWDFVASDDQRVTLRNNFHRILRARLTPSPYFRTDRRRDGGLVDVQIDWTYRTGANGDLQGLVAVVTDVTERNRAERQLREGKDRLHSILESMPVMMVASDSDGNLAMWNKECERVVGYGADEVVGKPWAAETFYPDPESRSRIVDEWRKRRGDYRNWETQIICKRGKPRRVAWSSVSAQSPIPGWASWAIGVDVTERVEAERALRTSEETLRSVTDSTPDILMLLDLDGAIRFLNRAPPGQPPEEVIGAQATEYLPEGERETMRECLRRVATTGKMARFDCEYQQQDGEPVPYEVRVAPIFREGRVAQLATSWTDVTDRRRVENRFRALYKHFPLPSYTYRSQDGELVLVDFNDAALRMTDGLISRLIGKNCRELYGSHDPTVLADFERCFRNRETVRRGFSYRFLTTGRIHELQVTYLFVPPDLVVAYSEHLDDRKAAEEALRRSEQSLARAQQIAHVGNWDLNVLTNELVWSDEIYRIFGLEPQEFGATYEAFLEMVHPGDRERVHAAVENALQNREPYAITHRIVRRDDSESIVYEQAEITYDAQGRPSRMLGIVQDVTMRHQTEQQLKAALEEKETLLREVHHRVKNNLQVISSLLFLQSQKATEPGLIFMFAEMERRVRTMALIHENLYNSDDLGRVDLRRYLQMLLSGLESAHTGKRVRIETRLEDVSLKIHTAVPCGLIVNELVTNSFRHAFPGGATGTVQVELTAGSGHYQLRVSDDGVGLPHDFDLAGATSLGLRLVHGLTEQIGGRIELGRGPGAMFQITFSE